MNRRQLIFLIGLITFILAFPNIPTAWKTVAFVAIGVALMAISYYMRIEEYKRESTQKQIITPSYVETH